LIPLLSLAGTAHPGNAQQDQPAPSSAPDTTYTFKSTVRRVVVDVVVTDVNGNPIPGLTKDDFTLAEDGEVQKVLSFEPNGFGQAMDYTPPKLPPEPPNTFVNLPDAPEKGPLYVLLYDLVNMDNEDQMSLDANQHEDQVRGRQQLMKFIENKPEGARFAIFVRSDELHLIQGFTSDKAQLFAAIDPHSPRPHIPEVYLMGENVGRADPHAAIIILNQIASYLDGMPGRKNLIWFSGTFPLSLVPSKNDGPNYTTQIESTLNLMARNQIALYPVDVRGVVLADWHTNNGMEEDGPIVSDRHKGDPAGGAAPAGSQAQAARSANAGVGQSLLAGSYMDMDMIAKLTGGRAFYSNNDVSAELVAATQNGASYYTLTYSPSNRNYDGRLRSIQVHLAKKGYRLAYRRTYFGSDPDKPAGPVVDQAAAAAPAPQRREDDTLDVNMKHGAPMMHQLIFAAHVRAVGAPAKGSAEQMAQLAKQPAYLKPGGKPVKSLAPIPLQKYAIEYTVMTHQLQLKGPQTPMNLEIAAAAYDTDGRMLNAAVDEARSDPAAASAQPAKVYRMQQEIVAPLAATSIRVAIQDANTGRVGAMEIKLPLAPENQSASLPDGGKKASGGQTN
jgi:VWFA-related protein